MAKKKRKPAPPQKVVKPVLTHQKKELAKEENSNSIKNTLSTVVGNFGNKKPPTKIRAEVLSKKKESYYFLAADIPRLLWRLTSLQ